MRHTPQTQMLCNKRIETTATANDISAFVLMEDGHRMKVDTKSARDRVTGSNRIASHSLRVRSNRSGAGNTVTTDDTATISCYVHTNIFAT